MIIVKYFASLRSIAGKTEEMFSLGEKITLETLAHEIGKKNPQIEEMIKGKKIIISVNMSVIDLNATINDGDEVALLPPFSGGC